MFVILGGEWLEILEKLRFLVWGAPALLLILFTGIALTLLTRFCQFSLFPRAIRKLFSGKQASSRKALCTALAATVGTGNLAGVAGAICLGGPGAVFWIWVCGLLGMVIKYAEALLSSAYRRSDGAGGTMYLIQACLPKEFQPLAYIYAFFGVAASFGVGNAAQVSAIFTSLSGTWKACNLPVCGIILAGILYLCLRKGALGIADAAGKLVPFAAVIYIFLAVGVLILCRSNLKPAFSAIFTGVFHPEALSGGAYFSAMTAARLGISRGIFSSEAGMGTAAMAHAEAEVSHPAEQGLMGILEVFIDTMVICTLTALVILVSGIPIPFGQETGAALTESAFFAVYGSFAGVLFSLEICLFAFATILGWGFYGARCGEFLFGKTVWKIFPILQAGMVVLSSFLRTGIIWQFSEIVNGLMVIPNLITILYLLPKVLLLTRDYQKSGSVEPLSCQILASSFSFSARSVCSQGRSATPK